ncbi:MAG: aldo/keto reductase [Bauldia sp.]|uniref:aldo/keto reductase n=1 Tax=Bauldia sp. TaxID=2575872 RepID=UPI001D9E24AB|nr:aldo/keto reductase [Bauldia sp.]MCB1494421.1 aldo/keto reductase [Bauldia sp.]
MDPFQRRKLGRSDVMLPQFGFGGAPLGDLFTKVSDADAEATLSAAWDAGVRYYDTAPWYGRGQSEHRIGRALYSRPRNEVIISTKVGRILRAPANPDTFDTGMWAGGLSFDIEWNYSYDGIMRAYEDSLQRLGMNRIDILIIHDLDWWHHQTDAKVNAYLSQLATSGFRALEELKAHGLIGAIGAGVNELRTIPAYLDMVDLDFFMLALRYTLGEQDTLDRELPMCAERGVGFIVAGVFSSGIYATGPIEGAKYNYADASPEELERARRIEAVCKSYGVPLASVALQFPLHHPLAAAVIPGGFRPEHVTSNLELFRQEIPDGLWSDLKSEGLIRSDAPTP